MTIAASDAAAPAFAVARRIALIRLATSLFLAMTTWFSASAVLPQLRDRWDLSTAAGSWLTIAVQIGFVLGALALAAANLADLVAPRRLVLVGALGAAAANAGLLVAPDAASAVVLRVLTGAFLAAVYPPAMKAMATWYREGRGWALGVMVGALTLGSAAPHLVNAAGGISWQGVVVATSVATVVGGVLAETWAGDGPYPFPSSPFDPRRVRVAMADRGVRLATIGYFGHMWELYAMWAWIGVYLGDRLDSERAGSLLAFVAIGAGAGGSLLAGRLGDRWGRAPVTILSLVASGTAAVVVGFATVPALAVTLAIVWGFWVVADSAQFSAAVTEHADPALVGTALTVQLASGFVLTVATIWLVPVVETAAGWGWAFALLAPGPVIGVLAMRRLRALELASTARPHPPATSAS